MSTEQLIAESMALPLAERISLAQALWQSINADLVGADEYKTVRQAVERDQALSFGAVAGRAHVEVIQAARRAIG